MRIQVVQAALATLFLNACMMPGATLDDVPMAPTVPEPVVYSWRPEWDTYVERAIIKHSPELLENRRVPRRDVEAYCPRFTGASKQEKARFWAAFLQAVAKYESNFDPQAAMQEGWNDPETSEPQFSQGLLQLSYSDRRFHPDCAVDRAQANIFDPEVNLSCGVAILRKQIEKRGTLFPGPKPYYWAVLTREKTKKKVVAYLEARTRELAFCL